MRKVMVRKIGTHHRCVANGSSPYAEAGEEPAGCPPPWFFLRTSNAFALSDRVP